MILEELKNYHRNLQFCYEQMEEKGEHLGVADKFLIRHRYNKIIQYELLSDKTDIELNRQSKLSQEEIKELYNFGVARAVFPFLLNETPNYF